MICTYSLPGILYSLSSLKHRECRGSVTTVKCTNTHLIVECHSNPVDEDIFGQAGIWILDPAEGVHHFSTVELLNQLFQPSIWCINIAEKSNGYCGSLCNCGHFFPLANDGVRKQRQAIPLCRYSSTAAVCWRWNSCTHLIICRDHKNLIKISTPLLTPFFSQSDVIAVSLIGEQGPVESSRLLQLHHWLKTDPPNTKVDVVHHFTVNKSCFANLF